MSNPSGGKRIYTAAELAQAHTLLAAGMSRTQLARTVLHTDKAKLRRVTVALGWPLFTARDYQVRRFSDAEREMMRSLYATCGSQAIATLLHTTAPVVRRELRAMNVPIKPAHFVAGHRDGDRKGGGHG